MSATRSATVAGGTYASEFPTLGRENTDALDLDRPVHEPSSRGKARATAVKNLSHAEDHFADHFPGFPVMPAPLILEGLAQTGGILVGESSALPARRSSWPRCPTAKFYREAVPGEQLTYATTIVDLNDTGARVTGTAYSGAELIAEAEIMFAHVTPEQLPPGLPDTKFVFRGELTHLLRAAEAAATKTPA